MLRPGVIFILLLVAGVLRAQVPNPSLVQGSFGFSYTDLKYAGITQDGVNEDVSIDHVDGAVHNAPGITFGISMTTRKDYFFHFYMGAMVTTAKAYGARNVYYQGVMGKDTMISEMLRYKVALLEIPLQFGWSFSERYPITFTGGITLGLPMTNLCVWNYHMAQHRTTIDPQGNPVTTIQTSRYSEELSTSSALAYSMLLSIPVKKLKEDFVCISIGMTGYMSAISHLGYKPALTYDIMRLKHNSYFVRCSLPLNFNKEKKPKKNEEEGYE